MNNYSEKEMEFIKEEWNIEYNLGGNWDKTQIRKINENDNLDGVDGYIIQLETDYEYHEGNTFYSCYYIYKIAKVEFKKYIKDQILLLKQENEKRFYRKYGNIGKDKRFKNIEIYSINKIINHIWKTEGYNFGVNTYMDGYPLTTINYVFQPKEMYKGCTSQF